MIIPTVGSIVKTICAGKERVIRVEEIVLTHDNLYLIKYYNEEEKVTFINCSLITEIIYYNKINPKPINYFKRYDEDIYLHYSKKTYCGPIPSIVSICMSKLPYNIDRPIDSEKLMVLFNKTKPGLIGKVSFGLSDHPGFPIIKKNKIKKWVVRNWNKFLINKNDWKKEIDQTNKEIADEYWADLEKEMEKDFYEDDLLQMEG